MTFIGVPLFAEQKSEQKAPLKPQGFFKSFSLYSLIGHHNINQLFLLLQATMLSILNHSISNFPWIKPGLVLWLLQLSSKHDGKDSLGSSAALGTFGNIWQKRLCYFELLLTFDCPCPCLC